MSALDPEYLKKNTDILAKNLTDKLVKKGNTSLWNKKFTVDNSQLEKISAAVKSVEEKKSDKFVENKINEAIWSHAMSDSVLEAKLSKFLDENKKDGIKEDVALKKITTQGLVKLRKINPDSFDKILSSTTEPTPIELKPTISKLSAYKIIKPPVTPRVPVTRKLAHNKNERTR